MDNQIPNQQQPQRIPYTAFASKFKSKKEIYQLLTVDVRAYLPSYDTITIYFLKDIISGAKKCKHFQYPN